ncbi:hypothetical protein GN300_06825 [Rhodococcus sp. Ni2]|uniref:hypothetical protein n=1 Tax=Rhodococcus TaxID=1827 RepID=UPI000A491BCD|nr:MULTISPECIES: hypothetical protein [Rhodococcus]MCE4161620.1 hypothetical protein [Rhodococcus sp. Ni2]
MKLKITSAVGALAIVVGATLTVGAGTASAAPTKISGYGGFLVGSEVEPGTYSTSGGVHGGTCTWARLVFASNGAPVPVEQGQGLKPMTVTIKSSDSAFVTDSCGVWEKIEADDGVLDFGSLGSGSLGSLFGS